MTTLRPSSPLTPAAARGVPALASPPGWIYRSLPNWLTASRVLMAGVFFGALTIWRWEDSAASRGEIDLILLIAAALFVVAVLTDALDGYLARRWNVESTFGRIMDPFADKILVVGAFVFLAGPDFWFEFPAGAPARISGHGIQLSGVYPWMVVVIMGRELLVTSIRGTMEAQGFQFGSDWWGKGKMILQSLAIPAVIALMAIADVTPDPAVKLLANPPARVAIDLLVWTMLAVTVLSGAPYLLRAAKLLH
ncbi:MAG: CDP-alcohol phosphatidyltransferase family protein, partial [Phycisphaerales bacterium]|nr:CDP-alcohol phosphatidyltransferase family protein [Phycisphaerales bacterium]